MIHVVRWGLWAAAALALAIPGGATISKLGQTPLKATLADSVQGDYLEARTCQVYTGPCFANGEMNIDGKEAIMAWSIREGTFSGVDLSGLKVVMVLRSSDTLGFEGIAGAGDIRSLMLVDNRADAAQRAALVDFAKRHSGKAGQDVVRIDEASISMSLDHGALVGRLEAGDDVLLQTRKARPDDCICHNEIAFYPPLADTFAVAPGVATEGGFFGSGLGSRWDIPDSRSVYMGLFQY